MENVIFSNLIVTKANKLIGSELFTRASFRKFRNSVGNWNLLTINTDFKLVFCIRLLIRMAKEMISRNFSLLFTINKLCLQELTFPSKFLTTFKLIRNCIQNLFNKKNLIKFFFIDYTFLYILTVRLINFITCWSWWWVIFILYYRLTILLSFIVFFYILLHYKIVSNYYIQKTLSPCGFSTDWEGCISISLETLHYHCSFYSTLYSIL